MLRNLKRFWSFRNGYALFSKRHLRLKRFEQTQPAISKHLRERCGGLVARAVPLFAFSIPFFQKLTPEEEMLSAWIKATEKIESGDFKAADSYLHTVLKILSEQRDRGEITEREFQGKRARVTSEMANVSLMLREHDKSEKLLMSSMKDCIACGLDPKGPVITEMSLKLAQVMTSTGRHAEAEQGFRFCIEAATAKLDELKNVSDEDEKKNARALLGICANGYSKFLHSLERYKEALTQAKLAHEQAMLVYEETNPNVITLLGDIGVLNAELGNLEEAEKITRHAIAVSEFQPDILLECLPVLYVNLGSILLRSKKLKDAEIMGEQAKRLIGLLIKNPTTEVTSVQVEELLTKIKDAKDKS